MRLLIKLEAIADCAYDLRYYHKLQGFIYDLLRGSDYHRLHDESAYKFFCFSNIFPSIDIQRGDLRHFMISSPDTPLIQILKGRLENLSKTKEPVYIGEMDFRVRNVSTLNPKVRHSCNLTTGTPIVIRIPKINYPKYGIQPPKDYSYVYWRRHYAFDAFTRQLEDNLFKKYNQFYGISLQYFPIFEQFVFTKQVCNHVIVNNREIKVLGSLWKFGFCHIGEEKRRIVQFGLDCGFGEMNSLGFGFMNIMIDEH